MLDKKIILINGAPRSGKDTAADIIEDMAYYLLTNSTHLKLSQPIKNIVKSLFGHLYNMAELESKKDQILDGMFGKSYRDWQISAAEDWLKKTFGKDFFVKTLLQKISKKLEQIIIISDLGFQEEIEEIAKNFENVFLLKISRNGTSYLRDSRRDVIITDDMKHIKIYSVENNSTMEDFRSKIGTFTKFVIQN